MMVEDHESETEAPKPLLSEVECPDCDLRADAAELEAITLRLGWLMRRRLEQELDMFGLTMPQHMALSYVWRSEHGRSMSEVAEASHQLSATMTGIIDRLVDRGLVLRERDPNDRRALRVRSTPEGDQLMEKVIKAKQAWMVRHLAVYQPEERRELIAIFSHFLDVLEKPLDTNEYGELVG